jgi:hypothetical protein
MTGKVACDRALTAAAKLCMVSCMADIMAIHVTFLSI